MTKRSDVGALAAGLMGFAQSRRGEPGVRICECGLPLRVCPSVSVRSYRVSPRMIHGGRSWRLSDSAKTRSGVGISEPPHRAAGSSSARTPPPTPPWWGTTNSRPDLPCGGATRPQMAFVEQMAVLLDMLGGAQRGERAVGDFLNVTDRVHSD